MRKNLVFLLVLIFSLVFAQAGKIDSVLMRINGNPITKSEFEYLYRKNNYTQALEKKTLDQYLDMFINFKLKVEDAKALGLDTTKAFINELSSYREELVKPYLVDQDAVDFVLKEAYERMSEDIEVSHILVRVAPDAADSLPAFKKIQSIRQKLKRQSFEKLAREFSEDESAVENSGYIGWISAFSTVYLFENQAYKTPVSKCSDIFRTAYGYHILKVHKRRKSMGSRLTAHIMTFTQQGNEERNRNAKNKIDSLYKNLLVGESFETLAKNYSEDRTSAVRNGELPWIKSGTMIEDFEKVAFNLKEIGEISPVFQSVYGWHIVKLIDKKELGSFEDLKPEIETKIKGDARAFRGKEAFAEKLKKEYQLKIDEQSVNELLLLLKSLESFDSSSLTELKINDRSLFSFANQNVTQADFITALADSGVKDSRGRDLTAFLSEKINDYVLDRLFEYENQTLETKHNDLRFLLQEYYDGILLFEVSNLMVWDKASQDTVGLSKFFEQNKNDYLWDKPHYKGYIVQCKDKKTLKMAKRMLKKLPADSILHQLPAFLNDTVQRVLIENGLFAQGENKIVDSEIFKSKEKLIHNPDFPYFVLKGKKLMYSPESYKDIYSLLVNDYQKELEEKWIAALREKYKVEVDREILKTIKEY